MYIWRVMWLPGMDDGMNTDAADAAGMRWRHRRDAITPEVNRGHTRPRNQLSILCYTLRIWSRQRKLFIVARVDCRVRALLDIVTSTQLLTEAALYYSHVSNDLLLFRDRQYELHPSLQLIIQLVFIFILIYLDKTKHEYQGRVGKYRHQRSIHDRAVLAVQ